MKQYKALLMILSLAAMVLFSAGCSKLTKQNYDKLKVGMEYKAVCRHYWAIRLPATPPSGLKAAPGAASKKTSRSISLPTKLFL